MLRPLALVLVAICAAVSSPAVAADAPSGVPLALTFDDMPAHGALPPGLSRAGVIRQVIAALATERAPAHAFLNADFGHDDPSAAEGVAAWREAGLPVGNHGFHHRNLAEMDAGAFQNELISNEPAVAAANPAAPVKWFRYPFLSEGKTPEQMAAARAVLARHGYRIAAVTADFADWAYNDAYVRCATKRNARGIASLEQRWLAALRDDALTERARAKALYNREVPLVLLMHFGAFTARMLPQALALYRSLGFRFVPLADAQADPFYAAANDPRLPGPSPSLERAAAARNLLGTTSPVAAPDLSTVCR